MISVNKVSYTWEFNTEKKSLVGMGGLGFHTHSYESHGSSGVFPKNSEVQWELIHQYGQLSLKLVCGARSADVSYKVSWPHNDLSGRILAHLGREVKLSKATSQPNFRSPITLELHIWSTNPLIEIPLEPSLSSALISTLDVEKGLTDLTLYFGEEKNPIQVSKFMLMARSPVFRRMFQSGFKEKTESELPIPDISPAAGEEMITYMYTNNAPNLFLINSTEELWLAEDLWEAAEKYDLPRLKALCENKLAMQLERNNAARILLFVEHYHCGEALKDFVLSFITKDRETCSHVMKSEEWEDVRGQLPELAFTVFYKFFDVPFHPPTKKARIEDK